MLHDKNTDYLLGKLCKKQILIKKYISDQYGSYL